MSAAAAFPATEDEARSHNALQYSVLGAFYINA